MAQVFDIMVLGLGAHGSSALYHLAGTGRKVIGIDRFAPPHAFGSSHGESRIIRQAYHEDPVYVPFVKAAYPIWKELEQQSGLSLFLQTGGLMLGGPDASVIKGSILSAETYGIPYEVMDARALKDRFPAFRPSEGTVGVLEKEAGILFPERCIEAFLDQARLRGASLHLNEKVLAIDPSPDKIRITSDAGVYEVRRLIVSAGAWLNQLLPDLQLPLAVERQVLYWFRSEEVSRFAPGRMPIYIWEYHGGKMFYGIPDIGTGIKMALHHSGRSILPDELSQDVASAEIAAMQAIASRYLHFDPVFDRSAVCMYTNTPNERFIIDRHPAYRNLIVASPCSGHGFKFSSIVGRILRDLALDQETGFDLSPFSIGR